MGGFLAVTGMESPIGRTDTQRKIRFKKNVNLPTLSAMEPTNGNTTPDNTEYDNQDDLVLPGDEIVIEPDTEPDMNDRLNVRWNARNAPDGLTDYQLEQIHADDPASDLSTVTEIDVTDRAIDWLKHQQK